MRVRAVSVFQKIAVFEVVDLHRATHLAERFGGGRLGTGATRLQDLVDLLGAALPIGASLADRRELRLHDVAEKLLDLDVAEPAAAVMLFQRFEILVFREELREMLVPRECVEVDEHRVPLGVTGILAAQVRRVGEHRHDLGLDFLRRIREVDAVAERLAHLRLAVDAGQTQAGAVLRQNDARFGQRLAVHTVELAHDLGALLEHGELVLPDRHRRRVECRNVCSLTDGVAEEADRDARLEVAHLNLRLDGGVTLDARHRDEIHVVERQLGELRHHRLNEDAGLRGFRVGDAQVSEKHCGFVINRGNASAAEVMELMRQVEDKVEENSGVRLEAEVRRIGEF